MSSLKGKTGVNIGQRVLVINYVWIGRIGRRVGIVSPAGGRDGVSGQTKGIWTYLDVCSVIILYLHAFDDGFQIQHLTSLTTSRSIYQLQISRNISEAS